MPISNPIAAKAIHIHGTVQGVGMRPALWRLARQFNLSGKVWNDADGVTLQVWGETTALLEFIRQIPIQAPPLASISRILIQDLDLAPDSSQFSIVASQSGAGQTMVAADAALCADCLVEVNNPADRRYRYPFTNCTHCGPRLSMVRAMPYDRQHTSMAAFKQCPACQAEYDNPGDRRFHAQANACPVCGPKVWLEDQDGNALRYSHHDVPAAAAALIRQGYIIAIKGIGGFHLACDAANPAAVDRLRNVKRRDAKPFAIMGRDLAMLSEYAVITPLEQQLLSCPAAPIVLLQGQGRKLAAAVAPGDDKLGCLLPYTALHHILLQDLSAPIVLTSANRHAEPFCIDNQAARLQLADMADYWLMHDRTIVHRLDDSVLQVMDNQPRLLRRARGYAPQPIVLPAGFQDAPAIAALGAELKSSFCLLHNGQAIMSPQIGDLENPAVLEAYRQMLAAYQSLYGFHAQVLAVDRHEGYFSSQLGREWRQREDVSVIEVQHHHAHLAACMAESGLALNTQPVLGVVMDGLGLGDAGQWWGGEFLLADYTSYRRLATFQPTALLGGAQAIRQPWRNTYAQLAIYFDWRQLSAQYADLDIIRFLSRQNLVVLDTMLSKQLNSPLSSSCGRCFDAFAAALGICRESVSYEAQAAIGLEILARPVFIEQRGQGYPYRYNNDTDLLQINWQPFWLGLLEDLRRQQDTAVIAGRIHHGMATALAETVLLLSKTTSTNIVVFSGGVFQNRLLLEEVSRQLQIAGKQVLTPAKLPCNDGGLALGQAVIAAAQLKKAGI